MRLEFVDGEMLESLIRRRNASRTNVLGSGSRSVAGHFGHLHNGRICVACQPSTTVLKAIIELSPGSVAGSPG